MVKTRRQVAKALPPPPELPPLPELPPPPQQSAIIKWLYRVWFSLVLVTFGAAAGILSDTYYPPRAPPKHFYEVFAVYVLIVTGVQLFREFQGIGAVL